MRSEFSAIHKLELPITYLQMWQTGEIAWFAMELDYIRHLNAGDHGERMVIPLRETGLLERRDGRWILVAWHESASQPDTGLGSLLTAQRTLRHRPRGTQTDAVNHVDLSSEWDITEIEDQKQYHATLDAHGNLYQRHSKVQTIPSPFRPTWCDCRFPSNLVCHDILVARDSTANSSWRA